MTQRRRGYYDPDVQDEADQSNAQQPEPDFIFRGGCTLLMDPDTAHVRYCIYKNVRAKGRLDRTRIHLTSDTRASLRTTYFGDPQRTCFRWLTARGEGVDQGRKAEPFALLHRAF
jgi:hypothetical protein